MNVDTMDQTSIPTMPNQFVNIAKSAIVGNSGVKKEL
jgi:hypothetical protein